MSSIIDKGIYKLKKWGKDIDGEYIVDGYSFKGRKPFLKALEGLKGLMIKGFIGEVNDVKIQVLDSRIIGAELSIEIQCFQSNSRGNAVLKLYGPSTKKQNVVMVTRSKGNEVKYVVMLAEKVIEPLINKFLNDVEETNELKTIKETEDFQCDVCDKTAKTSRGLKAHVTKIHKKIDLSHSEDKQEASDNTGNDMEVRKMVEDILLEQIVNSSVEAGAQKYLKSYQNKCDKCDYSASANRRYGAMQLLKKHKADECPMRTLQLRNKCSKCEHKANNLMNLKRHMRDKHDLTTQSTSPPSKKQRKQNNVMKDEPMDIDGVEVLDQNEEDINEKDIMQKRSDMMDEKILNKQKSNDEIEARLKKKKIEEESKKKEIEVKILEQSQKINKKRKQSLKDQRKMANKKTKQKEDIKTEENKNIREVPNNCKHLVEKDDVLYLVPGDGCCGPNCGAAFLFHDEVLGPKLRMKMNLHMAKYWSTKYENLTQCSPGHPFERKLGNEIIRFTDPKELIEFLKTEDAAFIWTDSEDLAVLSDLYQIKIKIITSKGQMDENPTVNWIHPDPEMKVFAELKNVNLDVMVLYHEDDCHFSLVIDKNSELALKGSISSRLNGDSNEKNVREKEEEGKQDKSDPKDEDKSDVTRLKKELKVLTESLEKMKKKYEESEKELKSKTEQTEILKSEVKDLRMIIKLRAELDEKDSNISNKRSGKESTTKEVLKKHISSKPFENEDIRTKKTTEELKLQFCHECNFRTRTKRELDEHIEMIHIEDKEFNCNSCDFQTTTDQQLKKHFTLKHTLKALKEDEEIRCRNCGESFIGKRNLLVHRKQAHMSTVAYCKNFKENRCTFSSDKCYWNHTEKVESTDGKICCYTCDEAFESKDKMMIHRKNKHETLVRICEKFKENNCKLQNKFCWFIHKQSGNTQI